MPKPIKLPTWATSSPNVIEPSDGKKAQGWVPGEQPPAAFFNYWQGLAYEWIKYFDENAVIIGGTPIIGDVQVNGTLGVAGDTTLGTDGAGNLLVNGTVHTTGKVTIGTGGGADLDVFGAVLAGGGVTVGAGVGGGDLNVYGNAIVGTDGTGNLTVKGTLNTWGDANIGTAGAGNLDVFGEVTAGGDATVGGDLEVAGRADVLGGDLHVQAGDVIVSGSFAYNKVRNVPVALGAGQSEFVNVAGATFGCLRAISTGASQFIGLRIPANTASISIQVMHYKDTTASTYFAVEKSVVNWAVPGPPTMTEVQGGAITTAGWTLSTMTFVAPDPNAEYRLRWAPASTADLIGGVRFSAWADVGPLNTP